jgi:uncharacterized protein
MPIPRTAKNLVKKTVLLASFALAAAAAQAASFDCQKATTFVEKEVCNVNLLGRLDDALAENYRFMLAADIGDGARKQIRADQRKWLGDRNKCTTGTCVQKAYRVRIDAVCETPVLSGVHPVCTDSSEIK